MSVVAQLRNEGLNLWAVDGALFVEPKGAITEHLRQVIRAQKKVILCELASTPPGNGFGNCPDQAGFTPLSEAQERARCLVLAQLEANPAVQRTFVSRFEGRSMVVTLALRDIGTAELIIPSDRFNASDMNDWAALVSCLTKGRA